jgi:hypothetical protein
MKSLQWYRDYAAQSPEIGDDYEAMLHINEAPVIITPSDSNKILDYQKINNGLFRTVHSNDYVFCMFGVKPDSHEFAFTDEQKQKMLSFGDIALLITDTDEFFTRVKSNLIAKEVSLTDCHCGFVTYYDESVDSINIYTSLQQGMYNVAFQKRKKYEHQQEYRFLFPNAGRSEDFFELEIGDISDISEVMSAATALNTIFKERVNKQEATQNE